VLTSLFAGALAGSVAKTAIAPLDRTKINFQISTHTKFSTRAALRFLVESYRKEGFLSLWRGNSATLARIVPYAAIQFTAHEQWKRFTDRIMEGHLSRFISGSLAGVTAQSLTYPLDMARARLAVSDRSKYYSLTDTFRKVIKQEGVLTLYKGYIPTMMGVIPYAGFSFFTYETCKVYHKKYFGDREIHPLERLCFGALAGVIGQTSSYPFDIVRRRLQVNRDPKLCRLGTREIFLKIYREEGLVNGLYKGLSMNWLKGPIAVGLSFTVFDLTQSTLRSYLQDQEV
jgi:solute carrier family 25 protein 42